MEERKKTKEKNRIVRSIKNIPLPIKLLAIIIVIFVILGLAFLQLMYMGLSFWTDVSFINDSEENIKITPIGITEGDCKIGPIFSIRRPILFLDTEQKTRFDLSPGESKDITYDMDDQNLQFVIVEFPENDIRILKLDAELWENRTYHRGFWAVAEDEYSIPSRLELPICPDILKPTIKGKYVEVTDELIEILKNIPAP